MRTSRKSVRLAIGFTAAALAALARAVATAADSAELAPLLESGSQTSSRTPTSSCSRTPLLPPQTRPPAGPARSARPCPRRSVRHCAATPRRCRRAALDTVRRDAAVKYVTANRSVTARGLTPTGGTDTSSPTPTWGLDRVDQRDLPLEHQVQVPRERPGRARVHDRHRHQLIAPGVHRPDRSGRRPLRRRRRPGGLPRPRHPRRRHDRRHALRRREEGDSCTPCASSTAPAIVRRRCCRGPSTGSPRTRSLPAVANMSLRFQPVSQAIVDALEEATDLGVVVRGLGRQLQRRRVHPVAGERAERDHDRRVEHQRLQGELLELRPVRRHLRARREHHVGLDRSGPTSTHDQRHVDGVTACGRRRGDLLRTSPARRCGQVTRS